MANGQDDSYEGLSRNVRDAASAKVVKSTTAAGTAASEAAVALERENVAGTNRKEQQAHMEKKLAGLKEELKLLEMGADAAKKMFDSLSDQGVALANLSDLEAARFEWLNKNRLLSKDERAHREKDVKQRIAAAEKVDEELKKTGKTAKQLKADVEGIAKDFLGIVGSLTKIDFLTNEGAFGQMDSMAKKISESYKELKGSGAALQVMFASAQSIIHSLVNVGLQKLVDATWASLKAQTESEAALTKLTGTHGKYNDVLKRSRIAGADMSLTWAENQKSVSALWSGMAKFSSLKEEVSAGLTTTIATLSRLGVSEETAASNMNELTTAFGYGLEEAEKMTVSLAFFAKEIGVDSGKMAKDMQGSMGRLQLFGGQADTMFRKLAVRAKASGAEIADFLEIARGFDTFEGAQDKVNKLNQLMGGNYLNTVDLIGKRDEERNQIIIEQIRLSGVLANSNDHLTRKAMEAIFPGKQLNAILKELNMTEAERERFAAKAKAGELITDQLEQMQVLARQAIPILKYLQEQLTLALADVNVIEDIKSMVDVIASMVKVLALIREEMPGGIWGMLALGMVIKGLFGALNFFSSKVLTGMAAKITDVGLAGTTGAFAKFAAIGAGKIMALGVAFAFMGLGIGLAAFGFSYFIEAFKEGTQAGYAVFGMVAMLIGMFAVLALLIPLAKVGLPIFGLVALIIGLIGASVLAAGFGMKLFMDSLSEGIPKLADMSGKIAILAGSIVLLAYALGGLAAVGYASFAGLWLMGAALVVLAVGLGAVAAAMRAMPVDVRKPIAEGLGKAISESASTSGRATITSKGVDFGYSAAAGNAQAAAPGSGLSRAQTVNLTLKLNDREFSKATLSTLDGAKWQVSSP